jgi:hypothetical protein
MSENLNRDFSKYEAMSTEELEEILRLDAEAPEGAQSDTDLLLYVMEVLASRRNTKNITGNTAQEAWESFQQNYMPEEPQKPMETKKPVFWMRKLAAAAAVVALLILVPISANALTLEEMWDIFARWAKETFSFVSGESTEVSEPSPDDKDEFETLQELLLQSNRDASIVPTWIPEGFELAQIEKDSSPMREIYTVRYMNGDTIIRIQVTSYLSEDIRNNEVENDPVEIYTHNGIDYYIFKNLDQHRAIWLVDSYECLISGDVSINELKKMIDSIQKGK